MIWATLTICWAGPCMEFARSDAWQQMIKLVEGLSTGHGRSDPFPTIAWESKSRFFFLVLLYYITIHFWFPPYKRYGSHYRCIPCPMVTCQEWRCYRRLSHLRHGLHDPIKVLLGKPRQNAMVSKSWELTRPSSPRDVILKKIDLLVGSVENMGVDAERYIYICICTAHQLVQDFVWCFCSPTYNLYPFEVFRWHLKV